MTDNQECRFDVLLDLPRDRAFSLFVDRLDLWWTSPFHGSGEDKVEAGIEPFPGGSCYETDSNGRRIWGTVLSIEPPIFIRIAWQVSQDGEEVADPLTASRLMVNFREAGEKTRMEIIHNEFLRHGENGSDYLLQMRAGDGWPRIIANLREASKNAG
ncbi:SRPBCC family protein [Roseibium sp. MMSF_3544]|uniref:SRPBCC family protein n=1 Tax=unclassified Roseibium TaxID=2629323 RepID=UPI00273D46DF|nr:SRPBCC family protein [Roseibium sp. MMSF_3544]